MQFQRKTYVFPIAAALLGSALAQDIPPQQPKPPAAGQQQPDKITGPTVIASAPGQESITVPLGGPITVAVAQFRQLVKDPADLSKLLLFVAGHKIDGAKANSLTLDGDVGRIAFDLPGKIGDETLAPAIRRGDPMPLSIGLEGGQPIPTKITVRIDQPPQVIGASTDARTARFERPIQIQVSGLKRWIDAQKAIDPATGDEAHIRLFLAGHELIGARPTGTPGADGTSVLSFDVSNRFVPDERNTENRAAWVSVVSVSRRNGDIPVTIGIEKSSRLMQSDKTLKPGLYSTGTWIALGLIPLLAIALVYLGSKSDLVREVELDDLPAGKRSCYSLARCQMAVWFFLVIAAYIYITFTFGTPPAITPTILTLIGISAGTALAATVIDNSQRNERIKQTLDLKSRVDSLTTRIAYLKQILAAAPVLQPTSGGAAPAPALATTTAPEIAADLQKELRDKTAELADVQARLANLPPPPSPRVSSGFVFDLLREGSSVSFHRFQIAVWTVVLAIIFLRSVWHDLAMPEFDNTLLALMGISSGTYLGFKFPDKPMPSPDAGK